MADDVAANGLARLFSLYILPREVTIEPGGIKAVLPRRMGQREIDDLLASDVARRETTLLVMPRALPDFFEFTGFLGEADRLLALVGMEQQAEREKAPKTPEVDVTVGPGHPLAQRPAHDPL